MSRTATIVLALVVGLAVGIPLGGRLMPSFDEAVGGDRRARRSAVPDAIGAQDISGPYEVVRDWPQDLATLPGHEKWTYGGARGIFAESPEPRVSARRRRAAEHPASAGETVPRDRAERDVPRWWSAVAQRE